MRLLNDNPELVKHHAEEIVRCGELDIATDSFGDKNDTPVVLIMGLSTQLIHWPELFCRALASKGYWVIRFDNRDIGNSSVLKHEHAPSIARLLAHSWFKVPLKVPYHLEDMAADVIGLMDHFALQHAHIVGVSMGGMIAQLLAIHHSARIRSLTCIMSTTGEKRLMHPELPILKLMAQKHKSEREEAIKQGLTLWRALHGKDLPFPEEHYGSIITEAQERGFYTSGVLRQLAAITVAPCRTEMLKQINLPALILHGDKDPLLKIHNAFAMQEALPHAKLRVFEGMGHTLPQEYWSAIIFEINQLIKNTDA